MAFTPSKNKKRQNSARNSGTILAFPENQRQSTFDPRRKAPFLPPKTARTAGRSGRAGAEKRQAFSPASAACGFALRRKPPADAPASALQLCRTLPHGGATSGFLVLGGYALDCAAKAAQIADTGATARNTLLVTAASPVWAHPAPAESPDRADPAVCAPAAYSRLPSFHAALLSLPHSGGR